MNRSIDNHLTTRLEELERAGLFRKLPCPSIAEAHGGLVQFSSNDYLGLSMEPFLQEAATAATNRHGTGAGASRLLRGSHPPHAELEEAISVWKKTEAALVFSSGYAAAVGTISAIVGKGDVILMDKLCHASLIDGAKLSGALVRVFPHNNLERLRALLEWCAKKHPEAKMLILTESVFSMDGDCPKLTQSVSSERTAAGWLTNSTSTGKSRFNSEPSAKRSEVVAAMSADRNHSFLGWSTRPDPLCIQPLPRRRPRPSHSQQFIGFFLNRRGTGCPGFGKIFTYFLP